MYNIEKKEYSSRYLVIITYFYKYIYLYIRLPFVYGLRANFFKKCKLDKNFSHEIYFLALEFKFEIFQITRRWKTFHESGQNSEILQEIQHLQDFVESIRNLSGLLNFSPDHKKSKTCNTRQVI